MNNSHQDKILTIVTINYNNATGLQKTIKSLHNLKNHNDVELIFIDGLSTDESFNVASSFYTKNNLISEQDRGIYQAMNKGLKKAAGKYILWLNSGDEWINSDVKNIVKILENENSDLVLMGINSISKNITDSRVCHTDLSLLPNDVFHHQSTFILNKTAKLFGGYNENFKILGDQELMMRIYLANKNISAYNIILSNFYEGGVSFSRKRHYEENRLRLHLGIIKYHQFIAKILSLYKEDIARSIKKTRNYFFRARI